MISNILPHPKNPHSSAAAPDDARQAELIELVARFTPGDGVHNTAIAPLQLIRASAPAQKLPAVYEPGLCVVVQGRKQATLRNQVFRYDPLNCLLISVTMPVIGQILEATPDKPYLCVRLDIDLHEIGELILATGAGDAPLMAKKRSPDSAPGLRGLSVSCVSDPLLDAVLRLLRHLHTPRDVAILAPLAIREIYYRVLMSDMGPGLRDLAVADSHAQRVAHAIDLLTRRYAEPVRLDELARAAHMSVSSLHRHFKLVTAMSPLQFQKQLRLNHARRLMLTEGVDAASAGHRVGYESPSQFSREYRRLFGAPPRAEIEQVKDAVQPRLKPVQLTA